MSELHAIFIPVVIVKNGANGNSMTISPNVLFECINLCH